MPGTVFLEGKNVELRTIEEEDIEFFRDGVNHPEVRVHMGNTRPQNLEDEEEFFQHIVDTDDVHFLVCDDGEPMGIISLEEKEKPANIAEIGLWLHPDFHGNGYGTEATEILVDYAFNQLEYHKVYARAHEDNEASKSLWEKLGFQKEGELRDHVYLKGEHKNLLYFGLIEGERE